MDCICVKLEVELHIPLSMKEVELQAAFVLLEVICWDKFYLLVCEVVVARECDFDNLHREVLGTG